MSARKREEGETFEKYRENLKFEDAINKNRARGRYVYVPTNDNGPARRVYLKNGPAYVTEKQFAEMHGA